MTCRVDSIAVETSLLQNADTHTLIIASVCSLLVSFLLVSFFPLPLHCACMARHVWIGEAGVWQAAVYSSGPCVFSAVRGSRMWCPHDIGRDSWVWGEQGTLEMMSSPHEVGDEALIERGPLSEGNGVALS